MNIRRYIYLFVTAAVMTAAVTSCEKENDDDIFLAGGGSTTTGGGSKDEPQGPDQPEPDVNPAVVVGKMEVPALKDGNLFISHNTTQNGKEVMTYCLEFDTQAYHSRWVAFRFDATTRTQNTGRQDGFQDDPSLPSQYWIGGGGFGSGYDRGHLCASADRLYSSAANRQTFYMTNMSPQMSRFNQDYWVGFEGKVQDWGRDKSFSDTLYVVKGGTVKPDQIMGTISRNGHKVVVPKYYFMAILKVKNGAYSAIAFWMEHKDYKMSNISNSEIASKVVTIDKLEELTGIDFFPNLPDAVEEKVEASVANSAWRL